MIPKLKHSRDNKWVLTPGAADKRAFRYKESDPYPDLPPALLGAAAIIDYARITSMIYPFRGVIDKSVDKYDEQLLKPASYEVRPGDSFFYFDIHGRRRRLNIGEGAEENTITLPKNSITFCSTDEHFRLPLYIAMRFNLRIKHVHRGLLLGTGPLVDPGFNKKLLIPLHNLTDSDYVISLEEGLIWVEFTKTYRKPEGDTDGPKEAKLLDHTQKDFNKFFMQASGDQPIRSSIPTAVMEAERKAELAMQRVERLQGQLTRVSLTGIMAIIIALFAIVLPVIALVQAIAEK